MTPSHITYLAAQAHRDDLNREARRRSALEARVRQQLRYAPPRLVTRRNRLIPAASH